MASKQSTCWVIEHPEIGTAFVVADNWEQATLRAAEFWGVSWARTVSGMELVRRKDARKNICCRCGQIFHGSGDLCGACEKILRTEEPPTAGDLVSGEKRRRLRAVRNKRGGTQDDRREEPDAGDEGIVARGRL